MEHNIAQGPKAEKIEAMFNDISSDYDKLNHILSLGVDLQWRRQAIKEITDSSKPQHILDIACGTGDFTIEIAQHSLQGSTIIGADLSEGMLEVMGEKLRKRGLDRKISTLHVNCEAMPFNDNTFNRVTVAFGMRNVEHKEKVLKEVLRVLEPGGKFVMLELSVPSNAIARFLYNIYFVRILPFIGGSVSGNFPAYKYLPGSVLHFPQKREWMAFMSSCGFCNVRHRSFTMGLCRMYVGEVK